MCNPALAHGLNAMRLLWQEATGNSTKLIRVMPNTPCLVGETASAMCLGSAATEEDAEVVRTLFSAVGTIFKVSL